MTTKHTPGPSREEGVLATFHNPVDQRTVLVRMPDLSDKSLRCAMTQLTANWPEGEWIYDPAVELDGIPALDLTVEAKAKAHKP